MKSVINAEPFRIDVPDSVLADLKERIARTRWPMEAKAPPWKFGASLDYMRRVADHWQHRYDWRRAESAMNRFTHYRVRLGASLGADVASDVHLILERGSGSDPLPLIITHGWPGSFVEFLDVIERLAHPERFGGDVKDAFTVVVPGIPGYGFSAPPAAPITPIAVAAMWHELMTGVLGCQRYVAQGGDWGAIITSYLALNHPRNLAAIHMNMVGFLANLSPGSDPLDPEEEAWRAANDRQRGKETAYAQVHATRPQTLAFPLTDSPVGLAAWILEKYQAWTVGVTDPPKPLDPPYELDRLLDNVMLYWLSGIAGSIWLYVSFQDPNLRVPPPGVRVEVPTGVLLCPNDLSLPAPDRWIRRMYNLVDRRDAPRGGHFIAFEEGKLFVEELRRYFGRYRS
ncbi:MAG: epoxide hydrolase [Betaproteobacteria bacterium]|nr:epoxide hydrolase [Betaproteobacteria bacterium]